MAALEKGSMAPGFQLEDLDEKTRSLDDLESGDLLLLVFYHSGCPTCQMAMPFIGNLARGVKATNVMIWGVSQDEEDESERFAQVKGLSEMPVMVDAEPYPVSQAYGLTNVPTLFLIDSERRIIDQSVGFASVDFVRFAQEVAKHAGIKTPDIFAGQNPPPVAYG
jgi:peroxiredoxin